MVNLPAWWWYTGKQFYTSEVHGVTWWQTSSWCTWPQTSSLDRIEPPLLSPGWIWRMEKLDMGLTRYGGDPPRHPGVSDLITGLTFFTPSCWNSVMIESFLTTWSRVSHGFFFIRDILDEIFDNLMAVNNHWKFIAGRYSGTSVKIPIVKIWFTPKLANYLLFWPCT